VRVDPKLNTRCTRIDRAWYRRLKLKYDEPLSNFAFNFNLRHYIKHRMNERRGIGGIFFDDMNDRPQEELLKFATDMAGSVVPAYLPIVTKHKDDAFTAGAYTRSLQSST